MNKIRINLFNWIYALILSAFAIIASLLVTINLTLIYKYCINKFNLDEVSKLTSSEIMSDYKTVIHYIQNPFKEKLSLNYFTMSNSGEFHFYEVQQIFKNIYIFIAISIIILLIGHYMLKERKNYINILKIGNYSSNIIIFIFITLISAISLNFSEAFEIFHKMFFNNDDWLFDPLLDPIINVLPEEVFMIYGVSILSITLIIAILFKILYYINNHNRIKKCT